MPGVPKALHIARDWETLQKKCEDYCDRRQFDKHPLKSLINSLPKLYIKALESKRGGDQEECYLVGMKYCTLLNHIKEKGGRGAVVDCMKNYQEILNMAEDISEKLRKRYKSSQKEASPVIEPTQPQSAPAEPQSAPAPALVRPTGEKGDVLNGVSGYQFISNKQLFDWLNSHLGASGVKKSVLLIDVRPAKDYETSHIKSERSISCPQEIIEKGKIASYYGSKIDPKFKPLWDERKYVDHLVLIDWSSTTPDLQENSPLEDFKQAIDKYDPGPKYLSCPYILDGGFELWNSTYPNCSTRSRVQAPSKEMANSLDLTDVSFPNLGESPKGSSFGNGGEPSLYTSLPTDKRPPLIDRSSKILAERCYGENKSAQLKLKNDLDRSKLKLDRLDYELLGNQTKELLDQKKKLQEECIELNKQHQAKEEENERLKREINELKRAAEARQAPKPRVTPMTTTDEVPDQDETRSASQKFSDEALTNDDLSAVPLKQDEDALTLDLKRSRSTPNIAQIEWQRPPTYDRSTKPVQQGYGYGSIHRSGLAGLKNLGNTCYMNSIVQCISHTWKLAEYFCSGRYQNDLNESASNPTGGQVARRVASVVRELWSGENRFTGCEDLKRVVGRYVESFAGTSQQDSHEFLTFLMDWLHNDLCRSPRKKLVNQEMLSGPKMAWAEYKKASDSIISDLFFVQQVSTVHCRKCREKSVTCEEPTSNLTLQLPSANNRCTLQDCLRLYTSEELISGYRCESCEQTNDAVKKVDIWRLPQILVIHLKRFYSDGLYHKRQTLVDFPLKGLEMRDFTSNTETPNTKYDLYAVSNHYGTLEGGHYTAFCRNKEKWYKFDDQDVTELSASYVKSPNAYILFYEQT